MKEPWTKCPHCGTGFNTDLDYCPKCHTQRQKMAGVAVFARIMMWIQIIGGIILIIAGLLSDKTFIVYGISSIITSSLWAVVRLIAKIEYHARLIKFATEPESKA